MARRHGRVPTVSVRPRTGTRSLRRPRHNYHVRFRPFEIQPFCIAPVLAGDSVKSLRFEARVLTDPIVSQVAGWWAEMYWFYVPLSALDEYAAAQANIITEAHDLAGLVTAANTRHYESANGPSWLSMCMKPIIRQYFRREGEEWDATEAMISTYPSGSAPIAGLVGKTWVDTILPASELPTPSGGTDYEDRWELYQGLRKQGLVQMSYPEYLRLQGIAVPEQLQEPESTFRKPELWRFIRQFTYPANVVNPAATNQVVSACSWVVAERLDKSYFCGESGFIVGVAVVRPKLYRANQVANATMMLRDSRTWLPHMLSDAPQETLDERSTNTALNTSTNHVVDIAGLFQAGDQFIRTPASKPAPVATLPSSDVSNTAYPVLNDILGLFAGDPPSNPETTGYGTIVMDGTATFAVTGRSGRSSTVMN